VDCKRGSYFANSNPPLRIQDDMLIVKSPARVYLQILISAGLGVGSGQAIHTP
jgi:hypothetical protein